MTPLPVLFWSIATSLAAPALRLLPRWRLRHGKEVAGRLAERRGIAGSARPPGRLLWLHAASVGETVSILPVLAALTQRAPDLTVLLTTGTVTAATLLARRLPDLGCDRVIHRFIPLDVPRWVARFLDHWRPDAAGFVESELWPNLLAACRARRLPLLLLNARMSPRSYRGWQRAPATARWLLGAFTLVLARSTEDAKRLTALGAPNVRVEGDLKFAAPPLAVDAAELTRLTHRLANRPLWLAASIHPGEDQAILAAHAQLAARHPGLLTIIAPRHPERGAALAARAQAPRRSLGQDPSDTAGLWIADTLGELGLLYRLAAIAFVGNSLGTAQGGQNPLEPARLGCAIAVGPHTGNFAEACLVLERAGGLARTTDEVALAAFVDRMLRDMKARDSMASAALGVCRGSEDLPGRVADIVVGMLA